MNQGAAAAASFAAGLTAGAAGAAGAARPAGAAAAAGHPTDPSHEFTIGPPSSGDEHRELWARRMPPEMAASAWPAAPPRKARAREDVTASQPHPFEAKERSWRQHSSSGWATPLSAPSGANASQSAVAYLAAMVRKVEARGPQGPVSSWEPRMEQVRGLPVWRVERLERLRLG